MKTDGVLAASQVGADTQAVFFWILAVISVIAALSMVMVRKTVYSAVALAVVMLCLAGLFALAGAPFLAFVQVIVYTGAVLMLFLFVLMIVGVSALDSMRETIRGQRLAAGVFAIAFLVLLSLVVGHAAIGPAAPASSGYGAYNIQGIARLIFSRYVYAFEVTSALLITAALGAMVLAHRERTGPKPTQREMARRRVAGGRPQPLPGPGVYARHDAADLPALLPDGSPARESVSAVLTRRAALRSPGDMPPEVQPGLPAGQQPPGGQAPSSNGHDAPPGAGPGERGDARPDVPAGTEQEDARS